MTPYELSLYCDEYGQRIKQEQEEQISLAWLTAYWQRVKKMPNLKDIIQKSDKPKQQTAEQMLEAIKSLNASFGGEVK